MILGLSIGCAYKFVNSKNRDNILTLYRENFSDNINAIEFVISENDLKNFKISKINYDWLKELKYVSFHLLTSHDSYLKIFKCIKNNKLKIDNFICHIDQINNIPEFFKTAFKNKIIFENIDSAKLNYEDCFDMCFDTSHALKFGKKYLIDLFNEKKEQIKQIHLSNHKKMNEYGHDLFINNSIFPEYEKNKNNNIEIIKKLNIKKYPIIVENICNNLTELKQEIKFIKENL